MGSNIPLLEIDVGKYYLQPRELLLLLRSVKRTKGSWISVCQIISTKAMIPLTTHSHIHKRALQLV
jgi:hypothetical protein